MSKQSNNKQQQAAEEQPVHMIDWANRFYVKTLEEKIQNLEKTIGVYKGFSWATIKTDSNQQKNLQRLKSELDQALAENLNLKAEISNNKGVLRIATAFLNGEANAEELTAALKTGNIIEFLSKDIFHIPQPAAEAARIPNLNTLSEQ